MNTTQLLRDVFKPRPGERALVMFDLPHGNLADNDDWADRRAMASEWREVLASMDLGVHPTLSFLATGAHNADLPLEGELGGQQTCALMDVVKETDILIAMTEYSATAPLSKFVKESNHLRAASMPGVLRRMEQTALAADYREVARRVHLLADRLTRAESATVHFTTGHEMLFDLRFRRGLSDDGLCTPDKEGFPLINLPSGEAFIVPYEGERSDVLSRTCGAIPVNVEGVQVVFMIRENRIIGIDGTTQEAERLRSYFDRDPARRNVAELGLGCNDKAIVSGNVLEDEKAGMHWAYGRSEHLGGVTGPDQFTDPAHVVHTDIVYAKGSPIGISSLALTYENGIMESIMRDGAYLVT